MSVRVCVILFAVLIGLSSAARVKLRAAEKKGECVDNTLYAKFVCMNQPNGATFLVPGKCSEYYECSNGQSTKKSCSKFYDPATKKCVSTSNCVEVDNTDCVIPTPPPCGGTTPSPPPPCECPAPPTTPIPPTCPPVECPTPTCPTVSTCPPPVTCPEPPTCPTEPTPKPPTDCPGTGPGPCNSYWNPDDLYGSYVCRNKADATTLIVPSNCNEYFYCLGGWSYLKTCGSDLYFDPLVGACDKKENVFCPTQQTTELPSKPTTAPPTKKPTKPPKTSTTKSQTEAPTEPPKKQPANH